MTTNNPITPNLPTARVTKKWTEILFLYPLNDNDTRAHNLQFRNSPLKPSCLLRDKLKKQRAKNEPPPVGFQEILVDLLEIIATGGQDCIKLIASYPFEEASVYAVMLF